MKVAARFVPLLVACGPVVAVEQGTTGEGSAGTIATGPPATSTSTTTTSGGTTSPMEGTSAATFSFVVDDEGTSFDSAAFVIPDYPPGSCDIWRQDCPDGWKCSPMAAYSRTWDTTRCTPLADDPVQPGDPCTMEGSSKSGIDDCEVGSTCFFVDDDTLQGTCVALCEGNSMNPICEDPSTACSITHGENLVLCLPRCHPLASDCEGERPCVFVGQVAVCWASAVPEGEGNYGDTCSYINSCNPGLFCGNPDHVSECEAGADGCCTPFCDLDEPTCPDEALGVECISFFGDDGPPEYADLGGCVIPP
jgi:hypothetical protein